MHSFSLKENLNSKNLDLKIKESEADIIKSVKDNIITFISSKTGSGKSTQIPQYLYNYLLKSPKKESFCIMCTEPRSIASDSISEFIKSQNKNINLMKTVTKQELESKKPKLFIIKENDLLFQLKLDPYLYINN